MFFYVLIYSIRETLIAEVKSIPNGKLHIVCKCISGLIM
ncbi:hypothetical protein SAMN05216353_101144 [Halobacillus alkaliphilus]|uniref:Uncharacterized protein n=1 Tax=Halobacillus alkaliphilus TaxID=396056 RepID=A0A1I2JM11_9BACI|nr:hypothetical protein SAMN05216353_101144 [Halobacillus alkaliphilus]